MADSASISLSGDEYQVEAGPSHLPQLHREHSNFSRFARSQGDAVPAATRVPVNPFTHGPFEDPETSASSGSQLSGNGTSEVGRTFRTKPTTILPSTKGKQRQTQSIQSLQGEGGTQAAMEEQLGSDSDQPSQPSLQHTGAQFTPSPRPNKRLRRNVVYHNDTYSRASGLSEHHCKCCRSRTEEPTATVDDTVESIKSVAKSFNAPKMLHNRVALVVLAALSLALIVGSACGIVKTHGDNPRAAKGIYLAVVVLEAGIASLASYLLTCPSPLCLLPFCAVLLLGIFFQEGFHDLVGSMPLAD